MKKPIFFEIRLSKRTLLMVVLPIIYPVINHKIRVFSTPPSPGLGKSSQPHFCVVVTNFQKRVFSISLNQFFPIKTISPAVRLAGKLARIPSCTLITSRMSYAFFWLFKRYISLFAGGANA